MDRDEEDTLPPPLRSQEEREERAGLRALSLAIMIPLLVLFAFAVASMGGCAPAAVCPDARFSVVASGENRWYLFDEENWQRVMAVMRGLSEGACRLPPPPEPKDTET